MSRGLGKLQCKILDAVASEDGVSAELLRWDMWQRPIGSGAKLPSSWNSSFSRAVDSLCRVGRLGRATRPLAELEEWRRRYRAKALYPNARQIRLDLVPELIAWIESGTGPNPRYSSADNERFVAKQLDAKEAASL